MSKSDAIHKSHQDRTFGAYRRTAVVDLDGTILQYDHWRGEEHFGLPQKNARWALKTLERWGWRIVIFTVIYLIP